MAAIKKITTNPKPTLVHVGKHFIDPNDVSIIRHTKGDLFVIELKGKSDSSYPLWVREDDLPALLESFSIIG
jgi:hypothetical protein